MTPILSILIPTKDRYSCLIPVIRSLVGHFKNLSYEIVVQDNTEDNKIFLEFIEEYDSEPIKYFHIKNQISMSENCNQSVLNALGEYLILIGDDDYVFPSIMESIDWMRVNGIEALNNSFMVYQWQGVETKTIIRHVPDETYILKKGLTYSYKFFDTKKTLKEVITQGGSSGPVNMPRLYHGLVKKEALLRLYKTCGTFFPGASPDIAVATGLACHIDRHAHYDGVFSIAGASKTSNTGLSTVKENVGQLEDIKFLDKNYIDQWDSRIPKVWAVSTIWPQSMIQSLNDCKHTTEINLAKYYAFLLAISYAFSPKIVKKITKEKIKEKKSFVFTLKVFYYYCLAWKTRFYNLFTVKHLFYNNVKNIGETYELTQKNINKNVI